MTDELLTEIRGGLGIITVNRPDRRNALRLELWRLLPELLAELDEDPVVRVIVLRGTGDRAFVSGADISEFERVRRDAETAAAYAAATEAAFAACRAAARPVVAWIAGACFGGGLSLALACDLRLAADNARFSIPAARLGLAYGAEGVARLVDTVGPAFARDLLYSARVVDASEALRAGLVDAVCPLAELEAEGTRRAEAMAELAPLAVTYAKRAIDAQLEGRGGDARVEAAARACFESDDYQEGVRAFLEKRKPSFEGS